MTIGTARRKHLLLLAACAALALSLLSACDRDAPPAGEAVQRRPVVAGDEYVAIGDSYTAAPYTGPTTSACLRSTTNYPHRVAEALDLKLTDVSCSGASTQDVTEAQVRWSARVVAAPQADALTKKTDLVTISIGGNDFGILTTLLFGCSSLREKDPTGAPCRAADKASGDNSLAKNIGRVEYRLTEVIRLVAKRAPDARVIVVGYPQFVPDSGPCEHLPLAAGDYPLAAKVNTGLVEAQKNAAARAKVEYLDVFEATRGHDMCAEDPWIAGRNPTRSDGLFYHPYPEEQQFVADLLLDRLTGTAPPNREQPADH